MRCKAHFTMKDFLTFFREMGKTMANFGGECGLSPIFDLLGGRAKGWHKVVFPHLKWHADTHRKKPLSRVK